MAIASFGGFMPASISAKTASYTVTSADNGILFSNSGASTAITFTLPTRAANLTYFFLVMADFNLTVSSVLGSDIIAPGNITASNVAYTSPALRLGGKMMVWCNPAGTFWHCDSDGIAALTVS